MQYRLQLLAKQPDGSKKEIPAPPGISRTFEMEVSSMEEATQYLDAAMAQYKKINGKLLPDNVEFKCVIEDTAHPARN